MLKHSNCPPDGAGGLESPSADDLVVWNNTHGSTGRQPTGSASNPPFVSSPSVLTIPDAHPANRVGEQLGVFASNRSLHESTPDSSAFH